MRKSIFSPRVRSRFDGHDQEVLSGLADIVFTRSPANASIELVSQFYDVDSDLLRSEEAIFEEINANHAYAQTKNAAVIVKRMYENGVSEVLPVLYKVFSILATILQCPSTLESISQECNGRQATK